MMIFLDTNIVVSFLSAQHSRHERTRKFIFKQAGAGTSLVISPQSIGETVRVLTSPKAVVNPFNPADFLHTVMDLLEDETFQFVSPGKRAVEVALVAAARRDITSAKIFDLLIYGTMREHDITRIATFNEKDFLGLDGVELVPIP